MVFCMKHSANKRVGTIGTQNINYEFGSNDSQSIIHFTDENLYLTEDKNIAPAIKGCC